MDAKNWRAPEVDNGMDPNSNWRNDLSLESRQKIVNKIMDILQRPMEPTGSDGMSSELMKIALRLEGKIYTAAANQQDYLRKISLKLLSLETKAQSVANSYSLSLSSPAAIMQPPQIGNLAHALANGLQITVQDQAQQQLLSQNLHNNIQGSGGMQSSIGLASALSSITGLSQATISNLGGQRSGLSTMMGICESPMNDSPGQVLSQNSLLAAAQRQLQWRQQQHQQQIVQQQHQQQLQAQQQLLYEQQLQHQQQQAFLKQKLQQQSYLQPSILQQQQQLLPQSHVQQQQPVFQVSQLQSSQQSVLQSGPQPVFQSSQQSVLQQASISVLQQNQQSALQQVNELNNESDAKQAVAAKQVLMQKHHKLSQHSIYQPQQLLKPGSSLSVSSPQSLMAASPQASQQYSPQIDQQSLVASYLQAPKGGTPKQPAVSPFMGPPLIAYIEFVVFSMLIISIFVLLWVLY